MLVLVIERSLASGYEGQQTVAAQKEGSTLWADPMSGCYIDLTITILFLRLKHCLRDASKHLA